MAGLSVMMFLISFAEANAVLDTITPAFGLPVDSLAVGSLTTTPTQTPASTSTPQPWERYRLPDTLSPIHYNITLWPRLEKDEHGMYIFTGHSTVEFKCVKETDLILIHSNQLNLTKFNGHHATLTRLDAAAAPAIKTTWLQETTEYLVIQLNGKLVPGKSYQLYTRFQGELADDMTGFYRSHYTEGAETK